MKHMSSAKRITIAAVCVALCCILPMAFHGMGLGSVFSPMHIPVLLCGIICGGGFGLICGCLGPILSSILTGMPGPAMLLSMVPELMCYGLVTGLMMKFVRTKHETLDIYISLVTAMLAGRMVGGIVQALVYLGNSESYSIGLWATGYFVTGFPGIICQLILVPVLVMTLTKAKLIPGRYIKNEQV